MMIDLWQLIGGYFYDVFVTKLDWWAWVGIVAPGKSVARAPCSVKIEAA